jgi:hypothetical protein
MRPTSIQPSASDLLQRPVSPRQYLFTFLALFALFFRLIGLCLGATAVAFSRSTFMGIVAVAALLVSLACVWGIEKYGPTPLRYAIRKL